MSKKKRTKIRIHRILFLIMIVYLAWTYIGQIGLKKELEAKKKEKQIEVLDLEEEIKELNLEISNSDSLQFIEKVAREEMGMVKPREIIVIDENK